MASSSQVGSTRAAQYIAARRKGDAPVALSDAIQGQVAGTLALAKTVSCEKNGGNAQTLWDMAARRMSLFGGPIRSREGILQAICETETALADFAATVKAGPGELPITLRLRDVLLCQRVYLAAMADYIGAGGQSRGSALYTDPTGQKPYPWLPDAFTFALDGGSRGGQVQEAIYSAETGICTFNWRPVRPIPEDDDFFENVWRAFREDGNIRY